MKTKKTDPSPTVSRECMPPTPDEIRHAAYDSPERFTDIHGVAALVRSRASNALRRVSYLSAAIEREACNGRFTTQVSAQAELDALIAAWESKGGGV